jgi:hypothetical protein
MNGRVLRCRGNGDAPGQGRCRGHQMNTQNGLSDPRSLVQARLTARTGALVRTVLDHSSWVVVVLGQG